jgi:hypothetical protein
LDGSDPDPDRPMKLQNWHLLKHQFYHSSPRTQAELAHRASNPVRAEGVCFASPVVFDRFSAVLR